MLTEDAMEKRPLGLLLAAAMAIGSGLVTTDAAAFDCSGPYYDSRSWNTGGYPNSGGCYLSGAICYECWSAGYAETAGCEWGTADCRGRIANGPLIEVATFWLHDDTGGVTRVCVVRSDSSTLDETAFS